MEQIAVSFTDWWVPKTWLSPKVTIIDRAGNKYIEDWTLTELGYGWYIYNFDKYNPDKVYLYVFDGGSALENDYDRYKFWGNEFDAYTNKYSWGRTAAPYFTTLKDWITWRFDQTDKLAKAIEKKIKNYDDKKLKEELSDFKKVMRGKYVDILDRLDLLWKSLENISKSVVDTSSTNDWNNSKNFVGINGKLDLLAQYLTQFKSDLDSELSVLDDNVAQRIIESNTNINETMSNRVTIEQLLQQVERLETQLKKVVDTVVSEKLPKEIRDEYDVNVKRKESWMSDEEMMQALWMPIENNPWNAYGLNQWMSEWLDMWMNEGMDMWMSEGLGEIREGWVNAPVDMQWIAEPEMPLWY